MDDFKDLALRDARHIDARNQLPQNTNPASYTWLTEDGQRGAVVRNTERMVLDYIRNRPLYSASRINLSAYVDRLRQRGFPIHTHMYRSKVGGSFGVYAVTATVNLAG